MADVREGIGIAEAAMRLGISKDAVRRRIQRGTLTAFKRGDDRWLVVLPDDTDADDRATQRDSTPHDTDASVLLSTLTAQLRVKDGQIAEKDRQLAAREREISELHVMLQTAQRLIPATVPDAPHPPERSGDDESHVAHDETPQDGVQRAVGASWRVRLRRFMGWG